MDILRVDDFQSWAVTVDETRFLIDPWLTKHYELPGVPWLVHRSHTKLMVYDLNDIPEVHGVFLTTHFADHLDKKTLQVLDRNIPIIGTKRACRIAQRLGFEDVRVLQAGNVQAVGNARITAIKPGFPYHHNSIGLLIEETTTGQRALFESHTCDEKELAKLGSVDALVTTVEGVRLMGVQLAMDCDRALRSIEILRPSFVLPTGINPDETKGLLMKFLKIENTLQEFEAALEGSDLACRIACTRSCESVSLAV